MGGKKLIWVTHDESAFHANDDGGKGWGIANIHIYTRKIGDVA